MVTRPHSTLLIALLVWLDGSADPARAGIDSRSDSQTPRFRLQDGL